MPMQWLWTLSSQNKDNKEQMKVRSINNAKAGNPGCQASGLLLGPDNYLPLVLWLNQLFLLKNMGLGPPCPDSKYIYSPSSESISTQRVRVASLKAEGRRNSWLNLDKHCPAPAAKLTLKINCPFVELCSYLQCSQKRLLSAGFSWTN